MPAAANPLPSLTKARKVIAAIDKRIDAVRAELLRNCRPSDETCSHAWQRAWDSVPGLQGIERSLYARRGQWQEVRDAAETRAHEAVERRQRRKCAAERRERNKYKAAPLQQCDACGSYYRAA